MNVLSLFDGISCGQQALLKAKIKYDVYYASEIDKASISITQKNFPSTIQLGDVKDIDYQLLPKIDLLIGGSPCQSLSPMGTKMGLFGKSGLFYDFVKAMKILKPKNYLFENVKMKKEWMMEISNYFGHSPIEINSNDFVPQNRPRFYWTNIKVSHIERKPTKLLDILENDVDEKYYLTEKQIEKLDLNYKWVTSGTGIIKHKGGKHQQDTIYRYDGIMCCLAASHHGAARHLTKTMLPDGRIRRLTETECEKLQGLPPDYTKFDNISSSKRYEMVGNGWTIDAVESILKNINNKETLNLF